MKCPKCFHEIKLGRTKGLDDLKVRFMFNESRLSPKEIAHLLKVSPSAIYTSLRRTQQNEPKNL